MTTRTKFAATAVGLTMTALMLAGCGSGTEETSSGDATGSGDSDAGQSASEPVVYQFDEAKSDDGTPFTATDSAVTVQLSDELADAVPTGAQLAVDHFTLQARAFDTGMCRLDVEVAYANGGADTLSAPREGRGDTPESRLVWALLHGDNTPGQAIIEPTVVDELPVDEELERGVEYITEDSTQLTAVHDCSEDADDDFVSLSFLYHGDEEGELESFADVDVAVVQGGQSGGDGTTIMITGETEADLTPAGAWTAPDDD